MMAIGAIALAVVVALGGAFALHRGFDAADHNSAIAIRGWASGMRRQAWPRDWRSGRAAPS